MATNLNPEHSEGKTAKAIEEQDRKTTIRCFFVAITGLNGSFFGI